jgi:hypothetical protein
MFNKSYEERLAAWRNFRETLDESTDPFNDVILFYSKTPQVALHADPYDKTTWPDPWQLLLENQYCVFCRVLGMCYSLQLTERFKGSSFEIHIGIDRKQSETHYLLFVDDHVLGYDESVILKKDLPGSIEPVETFSMPVLH